MGERGIGSDGDLSGWTPPPRPGPARLAGRYARLERLVEGHAAALHAAFAEDAAGAMWAFLPHGPFGAAEFAAWVEQAAAGADPCFYTITDLDSGRIGGVASWLRITPEHGVIEVGWITYAPCLQRTRAATEAMALMAGWAFGAGYRRYEWKCNACNLASRRAAERLGFSFEGVFRNHMVQKERSRDSAWFASTDAEWPVLEAAYAAWLDPANFDAEGRQRRRLGALTAPARVASDPALRP